MPGTATGTLTKKSGAWRRLAGATHRLRKRQQPMGQMTIRTEQHDTIRVIVIENPPVNALGAQVRDDLAAAVESAQGDGDVEAIVIRGAGALFCGGADINEFDKPRTGPWLPEMLDTLEAGAKPLVAALHGTTFGGGLELALGCHFRVAAPSARLGLPEVRIGLVPGAGGTQRLPRVIGVAKALEMIVSGNPVTAGEAHALGLVDRLVDEARLTGDAVAFAREVAIPHGARRSGERAVVAEPGVFEDFLAGQGTRLRGLDAPAACVEAIRGVVELPFREGLSRERALFERLAGGQQSRALRSIFFAERKAAKIDGLPGDVRTLPIERVGIVGAGTMGGGIAMNFLSAGIAVMLVGDGQAPPDRGAATIRRTYERSVEGGRLTAEQVECAMGCLSVGLGLEELAECDLVIEAAFEDMDAEKDVFRRLDGIVRQGAILASNTSFLDIDEIASATARPEHVVGLHFFPPADVMRLLRIVRGARTAPDVLASVATLARRIGKIGVVARNCHGFIGNRMLEPCQRQADALALDGATPSEVDQVLIDFGMPMGPFQMADLAGLDLGRDAATSPGSTLREILCERDRRGRKNGHGFHDYDENGNRSTSAEVEALIRRFAEHKGIAQRTVGADEIGERLLYPMVNEAAKILDEGIAQRASDIDVVWVHGYGWPSATGGPLFWADSLGLDVVVAGLEANRGRLGEDGVISPYLAEKAAAKSRFYG